MDASACLTKSRNLERPRMTAHKQAAVTSIHKALSNTEDSGTHNWLKAAKAAHHSQTFLSALSPQRSERGLTCRSTAQ